MFVRGGQGGGGGEKVRCGQVCLTIRGKHPVIWILQFPLQLSPCPPPPPHFNLRMWGGGERGKVDLQEGNIEEKNIGYVVFTSSCLCTSDLYGPVSNVFDACRSITRASGRGLGPGN
jgi:hypothetical protein